MEAYLREAIVGFFESLLLWDKHRKNLALDKIQALCELLVENKIYLRDSRLSGQSDSEKENELAGKWSRVGSMFYADYRPLADICECKSGYWINRGMYSDSKIIEMGITIRQIEEKIRQAKEQLL